MKKNYQKWTPVKIVLNNGTKRPDKYHEGGIYWAYLGENIGNEQDGGGETFTRPVLIIRGFSKGLLMCAPISHTKKKHEFYYPLNFKQIDGSILLSQIRAIDTIRLGRIIATIPQGTLRNIKQAIAEMLLK